MPAARCLVSLVAVLVAAVCVAHAQERIKICGRELIRLAVSSCGSSRARRSIPDLGLEKNQYAPLWEQISSTEEYLTSGTVRTASRADGEKDAVSLAPHLLSSRIRRTAGKISDICCEKGCSMKELIQFC
ncbi:insulin-like 3 (Leydig cell) [Simochromis diagramma]|uniref:insulin-like 3 (Leydig cell) n=1 Tax=Haplochromis burtoni TaxID=8153 RepID=UPI0003BD002E|nr:insulin-like 3 (Leydig cell) [Haplochromis burtoni]XP_039878041.1 insulin-like 3 (Leydig cell) [Simochromis diagramma]